MIRILLAILIIIVLCLIGFIFNKYENFESGTSEELIPSSSKCPKGVPGEEGDKGDTGPQGHTGQIGPKGPDGERGLQGDRGTRGKTGTSFINYLRELYKSKVKNNNNKKKYNNNNIVIDEFVLSEIEPLIDKAISDKVTTEVSKLSIPEMTIIPYFMQKEKWSKDIGENTFNYWQLCNGDPLKHAEKDTIVKDGGGKDIKTPDLSNKFIKGTSNPKLAGSDEKNGSLTLAAKHIPSLQIDNTTLVKEINNKTSELVKNINTSFSSNGGIGKTLKNAYTNMNANCSHIKNLKIKNNEGAHNHTINFFNDNFNEYGGMGEPCPGGIESAGCGSTGGITGNWTINERLPGPGFTIDSPGTITNGKLDSKGIITNAFSNSDPNLTEIWRNTFITQGEGKHNHTLELASGTNECNEKASISSVVNIDNKPILSVSDIKLSNKNANVEPINIHNHISSYKLVFIIKRPLK